MDQTRADRELGVVVHRGKRIAFLERRPVGGFHGFVMQTTASDGSQTEQKIGGDAVLRALRDALDLYLRESRGCYRCKPR